MKTIKIKNFDTENRTWAGQEFTPNYEITIQSDIELARYVNDNTFYADVGSKLAKISDGSTYFEQIAAWNYLTGNIVQSVNVANEPTIEYTSRYFMKGVAVRATCPKNETTSIDLKVEKQLDDLGVEESTKEPNYIYKYLKGGIVFAEGSGAMRGDWARFMIVDKDAVLVALGVMNQQTWDYLKGENDCVVVKTYLPQRYINPLNDGANLIEADSPGKIPIGLYLRCKYTAINDGGDRDIIINYDIQNKD